MPDEITIEAALCSDCFRNQGLHLDARQIGTAQDGECPNCHSNDGRKLDKALTERLAFRFFVRGTYQRMLYGGAPAVQFNEQHYHETDLDLPDDLKRDIVLIEEAARIGFFHYGPRLWMLGEVEPLKALQQPRQRPDVIARMLDLYPKRTLSKPEAFYRLRKAPRNQADPAEYDSPPDPYLGTYRFDSSGFAVMYASEDIEVCIHECRVTVEDDLWIATLRPARDLTLLDLTGVVEGGVSEVDSLDIAVQMLFLAGPHSYEISRDIAVAANSAGLDGIIYPSYFSVVRTGRMPVETAYGISIRRFKGHEKHAKAQVIPNLALFGRPINSGKVTVDCINRLVLTRITYDGVFGPVSY